MWKYTISVMRAETRSDGLYIIGEASGPERDTHGTEMDPLAIADFRDQIVSRAQAGDPLPYRDSHDKTGLLLSDLGWVVDGEVTRDQHLKVTVKLDEDNPAALYLHGQVERGKQFGMSIKGESSDYKIGRDGSGNRVIRFMKVVLREISNTTRPSWVPSFGTVLARDIDGESGIPEEETQMSDELERGAAAEEQTPEAAESETPAEEVERTDEEEAPAADSAAESEHESEAEVERARIATADRVRLSDAIKTVAEIAGINLALLASPGIESETPETPEAPAQAVENSDTGSDKVDFHGIQVERAVAEAIEGYVAEKVTEATSELTTEVERQATYISELEALPAGKLPPLVDKPKFTALPENVERMSKEDRLRWALGRMYEGQ